MASELHYAVVGDTVGAGATVAGRIPPLPGLEASVRGIREKP